MALITFHLIEADVLGIGATPSGAVVAEDIRDLQGWTGHGRGRYAGSRSFLFCQKADATAGVNFCARTAGRVSG